MKNKKALKLNVESKLFDEWANGIVQNDCIYTLISDMFDNGWTFDMVKEYCLSHFNFEDGEFEEECLYYKNSKLAKHPELVKLNNYVPKSKKAKPEVDYSVELAYLNEIIKGTKRTTINDFDRLQGCLINSNWEDESIIIKNIMNTPAPEDIHVRYSIPYCTDYDLSLNVQIEIINKERYDMASFYCKLTAEVVQDLKTHNIINNVYGLSSTAFNKTIEDLTNKISYLTDNLNNLQSIKNIIESR